ncbi:MAG: 30S ribosomal protein S8 [Patescibacteria group bacterium]|nr:30S ribosomal protein S8 [Patescibacteria group bacterium]
MVTDPIADFITRISNAAKAGKSVAAVPHSKVKESIAHILKKAGYFSSVEKKGTGVAQTIEVGLIYTNGQPRIHGVMRVSKPSRRLYQKARDIRPFRQGYGNIIYSTPRGILADFEAKKLKVGGEILFKIW